MAGVDKVKTNAVILAMSRGSKFYENELRKDSKTKARVATMLARANALGHEKIAATTAALSLAQFERQRDLSRYDCCLLIALAPSRCLRLPWLGYAAHPSITPAASSYTAMPMPFTQLLRFETILPWKASPLALVATAC